MNERQYHGLINGEVFVVFQLLSLQHAVSAVFLHCPDCIS